MHDLVVVGGGAAGLAAAAYALDKQLDVLIIAKRLGGKAGWQRPASEAQSAPVSAGEALVGLLRERMSPTPERLIDDTVTAIAKANGTFALTTKQHGHYEARAVLMATGVTPIALDVPGSNQLLGYGLGYSAATHAQAQRGSIVAAIGATTRALRGVHELSRLATTVYWIGPSLKQLMSSLGMGLQYRPNVKVFEDFQVVEVIGTTRVEALVIEHAGNQQRLAVDGAFVDLGLQPNSTLVAALVKLNTDGFIIIDEQGATTLPGLYAAGDVSTAFGEQLLVAIGQGARAAMGAYDYLLAHEVAQTV